MRRVLVGIGLLLVVAVVAPPLWFAVFPAEPPPPLPPGDRRIPVGEGASVSAVDRGEGPAVVLVHGLPGSAHDWAPTTELLARRGHRVIAYDRVGYGHSDARRDGDYTPDGNARDLLALLEHEDLRDATVVGWSYGGATAIRAAAIDDSRIGRLVLVGSAGYWPDAPDPPAVFAVLFSRPVLAWMRAVPPVGRALQDALSQQAFGDEPIPDWWRPRLAANFAMPHTPTTHREEGARMGWGESLDTASLDVPILVVHGDDDRLVPLEVGRILDERADRSQLFVVEGGSHMLPVTRPDELAKRIAPFVLVQ